MAKQQLPGRGTAGAGNDGKGLGRRWGTKCQPHSVLARPGCLCATASRGKGAGGKVWLLHLLLPARGPWWVIVLPVPPARIPRLVVPGGELSDGQLC